MVTHHHPSTHDTDQNRQRTTAEQLYDAECALHAAHQSHVEAWITAASNRLHEALSEYLATEAAAAHDGQQPPSGRAFVTSSSSGPPSNRDGSANSSAR